MVKIEDLKRIDMFKKVPDHLLDIISQEAQLNIFGTDTHLFSVGDEVDTFHLIVMGQVALKVALTQDIDVILDNLQAGSAFGSAGLLEETHASYTAVCQEPCEVISIYGPRLKSLFDTNPELAYHVMTGVAEQYKRTMDQRARMIMDTLEKHPDLKQDIHDIGELTPAF